MKKKMQADLKVFKVLTYKGRQLLFEVKRADGRLVKLPPSQMLFLVQGGHVFENATVSANEVVRVASDVKREEIDIRQYEGYGNVFGPGYEVTNGKLIYRPLR